MIIKIISLLFFMSLLNIVRHLFNIYRIIREEDRPNKYEISKTELIFVGLSVSYILTIIFTGFKI